MVTGEITLNTCYGNVVVPVKVLASGPRPGTVWVKALNGLTPFTRINHGGPSQDNTAVWHIPMVRNVRVQNEGEEPVEVDPEPFPNRYVPGGDQLHELSDLPGDRHPGGCRV